MGCHKHGRANSSPLGSRKVFCRRVVGKMFFASVDISYHNLLNKNLIFITINRLHQLMCCQRNRKSFTEHVKHILPICRAENTLIR